ncbi:MAG: ORF6N domain-containing protein [Bacteroidota bacterium]
MAQLNLLHHIYLIRGQKVLLDADLALIYGVTTRALNQAIKRNADRFPEDFMFRLSDTEFATLKSEWLNTDEDEADHNLPSQTVTANEEDQIPTVKWNMRRNPPNAFTEHGAIMLASVLRSERAIAASIQIVRAFVRMRSMLLRQEELAQRLLQLEAAVEGNFGVVFEAIEELMTEKSEERRRIGFK